MEALRISHKDGDVLVAALRRVPVLTNDEGKLLHSIEQTMQRNLEEVSSSNACRLAAQQKARDGELEVDDDAIVSSSDDGAYVEVWLWVGNEEVG